MKKYDAIIIGGGGGLKLRPIADMGKKIAIIEKDHLGGTCLNRGCIPSKMLIHTADVAEEIPNAHKYDLKVDTKFKVNFKKLVNRVNNSVGSTSKSIGKAYKKHPNIDYYHKTAKFLDNKTIKVGLKKITAKKIFIATGSRPNIPAIPGLKDTPYMTSTEALKNTKLPKKLIIIGGGYIAVELGHFYGSLGTKVEFIVRSSMVKTTDSQVAEHFTEVFSQKHKVHLQTSTEKVEYKKGQFTVTVKNAQGRKRKIKGDALLVAAGITPNSDTLSLENTDIKVSKDGFIKVNKNLQTSVKDIYALGDVIGNYFFRHSVNFEGEYLLNNLYKQRSTRPIKYPPMPYAVFSSPQIAGVGLTEDQLKAAKRKYIVGLNHYKDSAMGGDALRSDHGFAKLLFDKKTKKLLGAHIIGKEASDMIHTAIAFINMGATLKDMLNTIYIHPALPEIIRNAARKA